jgi:CelD/BcsL family acetyltransferase involved in cellulose biosynthesis
VHRGPPSREFSIEVIRDVKQLSDERDRWWDLFRSSLEPNVFFSPAILESALAHLEPAGEPCVVLVKGKDRSAPLREPAWCGFFPMVRFRRWRGIPLNLLAMLGHDYCFLRTPLIRQDAARDVMTLFLNWVRWESGASLLELADQTGDGLYHANLVEGMHRAGLRPTIGHSRVRSLLCRGESADAYLRESISGGKLKELRRLERRLTEQEGGVSFRALAPHEDAKGAIEEFLAIEKSGWKEREGTAIACRPNDVAFFRQAASEMHREGLLRLHFLAGKNRTIAGKCNFMGGTGSYAFKIGFAEEYAKFSPGVQLEIDNIRRFHQEPDLMWMDSCADPDHPMIDHLWRDRRSIHTWWIPLNRWGGTVTAFYPWAASMRKGLRGSAPRPKGEEE